MAVKAITHSTLQDLASRTHADGSVDMQIVEMLQQTNEILDDMTWKEGNLVDGHKTTVRTGIPEATWRKMYGGVDSQKSKTAQIVDKCGMLEIYSKVDKSFADLNGNTNAWRTSEDRAFIQGMSQQMAETIFYGDESVYPERFTGLAPRFSDLNAENGDNIIDAGDSSGNLRSIWLIGWSDETISGIVPKGSTTGLQMRDLGEDTDDAPDGSGEYQIYRTHYKWDAGLTVRDWRYIVRIANINEAALTNDAATGANLPDLMFDALELLPEFMSVRPAFYMTRTCRSFLRKQFSSAVKQSTLDFENVGGRRTAFFQETPVRRVDQLAVDETQVVGS